METTDKEGSRVFTVSIPIPSSSIMVAIERATILHYSKHGVKPDQVFLNELWYKRLVDECAGRLVGLEEGWELVFRQHTMNSIQIHLSVGSVTVNKADVPPGKMVVGVMVDWKPPKQEGEEE